MNSIQPTYNNRVQYSLYNATYGTKEISEPIGWNEDEKEFKRSTKVHGVFTSLSDSLKFYKGDANNDGGFDFVTNVFENEGINSDIILIKKEKNPTTDILEESYRGYLDLSTLSIENNQASVKFNESGLYSAIKARQNEDLELGRLTTMDGDEIEALETENIALDGRNILFVNELNKSDALGTYSNGDWIINILEDEILANVNMAVGSYRSFVIPIEVSFIQSGNVQTPTDFDSGSNNVGYQNGYTLNMFYAIAEDDSTIKMDFDLEFNVTGLIPEYVRVDLVKFTDGLNYNYDSYDTLIEVNYPNTGELFSLNVSKDVVSKIGESFSLNIHTYKGGVENDPSEVLIHITKAVINISDESYFDKSQAKILLPFEALERIIKITSNEDNALLSDFLGKPENGYDTDGDGSLIAITNGFWVRKFEDEELTTSFSDFIDSYSAIWNCGYGIEKVGFKEYIRFEPLDYFYTNKITITLPYQVKNVKRTVATDYFYSGLEVGYSNPSGDDLYEESMGLDEYNIYNTFTTIIKRISKVFTIKSTYRADSYGMEFARRKSITNYPTEDTRYDDNVFLIDAKRGEDTTFSPDSRRSSNSIFEQRLWADDFEKAPTGVYSPDTAQNLRLSPINILQRFGWWIKAGLDKYEDSYVRFSSTNGNADLSTQLKGAEDIAENSNILVSDLDKAKFLPEYIEFEHPVNYELFQNVQGKTGNLLNCYGIFEFINENGYYETGYLMNLKPNGKGSWKLLKANRPVSKRSTKVLTSVGEQYESRGLDDQLNTELY